MTNTTAPTKQFGPAKKEAWQLAVMSRDDLTDAQKLILIALSTFANSDTGTAWPSAGLVAEQAGKQRRTAQSALQKGEEVGLLVTVEKGRTSTTGANVSSVRRLIVPPKSDNSDRKPDATEPDISGGMMHSQSRDDAPSDVRMMHSQSRDGAQPEYLTLDRTSDRTSDRTQHTVNDVDPAISPFPSRTEERPHGIDIDYTEMPPNEYRTEEPQPLSYFTDTVELKARHRFKMYLIKADPTASYGKRLNTFKDTMADQNRRDWEATFFAFLKDDREWT